MTHPYSDLPNRNFWRRYVSDTAWRDVPFMDSPKFTLQVEHKLATAGSCFAQHITRHMKRVGLVPFVAEPAHPFIQMSRPEQVASYEQFSARYGNVYTARQGLELAQQAAGTKAIINDLVEEDGRWFDLLRPSVSKQGFATREEAIADRVHHLHCVRRMFESIDVFVFTLGLTECWQHADLGHTYPACPGTVRGIYDTNHHRFHNFGLTEVVADLEALIEVARTLNPVLKFIFTVSPVPLVATRTNENVIVASAYSKAVLRAAVGEVTKRYDFVEYFPSFEIISQPASFGQYLAADLRDANERGVGHVMSCFLSAFYPPLPNFKAAPVVLEATVHKEEAPVQCEEVFNDLAPAICIP
ncbi:MAG: GSCFA domain-containing protein [Polaromonas sp.]|nr:GSCFA domain-containing protein [Polaromonas sp.]